MVACVCALRAYARGMERRKAAKGRMEEKLGERYVMDWGRGGD